MNRFIINKLVFTGSGKVPAEIRLEPGLNVISGPSDTGKSLIFECLNYVLGGTRPPKEPPEAKGYTNLFLEIGSNGQKFTIERSVLSNDVRIFELEYDAIEKNSQGLELSGSANAKENLSDYLMTLLGIQNKKLKKNERNEVISLTFNILRKIILIDEGKIQTTFSPILTGQRDSGTSEKSLFRFLLTGIDYSNIIVQKKPEIRKAEANARISVLEHLIQNSSLNLKKDSEKIDLEEQLGKLTSSIEEELTRISVSNNEIAELQENRKSSWDSAVAAESKIDQLKEIVGRFSLLSDHYQSDLNRLDAIIETGLFLSITGDIHCPLCGSDHQHHRPDCVIGEKEISEVQDSCEHEKAKIKSLQTDLTLTINNIDIEISDLVSARQDYESDFKRLESLINGKLEPLVTRQKEDLRRLFETKKDVEIMISLVDQISEMEELKAVAKQDLKSKPKADKLPVGVQAAEINDLLKVIELTLQDWGYPNLDRIGFSEDQQDITIGNKNRSDQGKGYRAITHAAFIISLMNYCIDQDRPHPAFVVLDSPLVTFRAADKKIEDNEAIPEDMKIQFYKSLSHIETDRQIIIIENDDPPEYLLGQINNIHFTKDHSEGRYGFLPVS